VKVYRLIPAEGAWQFLVPSGRGAGERLATLPTRPFRCDEAPLPADLVTHDPRRGPLRPADLPWFTSNVPAYSMEAAARIQTILDRAGNLIPLETLYGEFVALDVRERLPALDVERSEIVRFSSSGRVMDVKGHVFRSDAIRDSGSEIFLLDIFDRGGSTYVTDAYVEAIQDEGLVSAVAFELVG
jgi:hypothetical protein